MGNPDGRGQGNERSFSREPPELCQQGHSEAWALEHESSVCSCPAAAGAAAAAVRAASCGRAVTWPAPGAAAAAGSPGAAAPPLAAA